MRVLAGEWELLSGRGIVASEEISGQPEISWQSPPPEPLAPSLPKSPSKKPLKQFKIAWP